MPNAEPPIAMVERGETLSEQAYERLQTALVSGVFKPGETLSIRQLAALIGVSATPARDAISRALWEGSLENGPNRTVVVPKLTLERLHDIYAVRLNLECLATELAAPNFNGQALAALQRIEADYVAGLEAEDMSAVLRENERFHFYIYAQSNNEILLGLIKTLWLKMGPSLNLLFPAYVDRRGSRHKNEIISALRERDGAKAREAVEADLIDGKAEVRRALQRLEQGSRAPRRRIASL